MSMRLLKPIKKLETLAEALIGGNWKTVSYFTYFELKKKNADSVLGLLWNVVVPLAQMLLYVFVFTVIFNIRFEKSNGETGGPLDYALYILMGQVPWIFINYSFSNGVNMVKGYSGFIRQPNFPYRMLPTVSFLLAMPGHITGLLFLFALKALTSDFSGVHLGLIIIFYLFTFLFIRGLSTCLGILAAKIDDIGNIIPLLLQFLYYMSPVLYKPAQIPDAFKFIMYINPLSYFLSSFKYALTSDPELSVVTPGFDLAMLALLAAIFYRAEMLALKRIRSRGIDSVS